MFVCFQVFCSVCMFSGVLQCLYVFGRFVVFVCMFTGVLQCLIVCLWCFAVFNCTFMCFAMFVCFQMFCSVCLYVYRCFAVFNCMFMVFCSV